MSIMKSIQEERELLNKTIIELLYDYLDNEKILIDNLKGIYNNKRDLYLFDIVKQDIDMMKIKIKKVLENE